MPIFFHPLICGRSWVGKVACHLMQGLYLETVDGNVRIKELIERLANLDRERHDRMIFEDTETGWHEAA
jgi:hypothetical protein